LIISGLAKSKDQREKENLGLTRHEAAEYWEKKHKRGSRQYSEVG